MEFIGARRGTAIVKANIIGKNFDLKLKSIFFRGDDVKIFSRDLATFFLQCTSPVRNFNR